jgi:hypothetical protein
MAEVGTFKYQHHSFSKEICRAAANMTSSIWKIKSFCWMF